MESAFPEKSANSPPVTWWSTQGNILRLPADKLSVSNEVIVELLRSVQVSV